MVNKGIKILVVFLAVLSSDLFAEDYGYFISFTDKEGTPYSVNAPQEFLSARAIDRRDRQNIPVTVRDLPVDPQYVDSLKSLGIKVKHTTKWFNGCIAFCSDSLLMDTLNRYGFVRSVELTYKPAAIKFAKLERTYAGKKSIKTGAYGAAFDQINTIHGIELNDKGYLGQGMVIAVIDAGFYRVDQLPAFDHLWENDQILGTKDFVDPSSNIFAEHHHGMNVLSIIGGKIDGTFMGTAPEADFWLLRTEDVSSEFPVEADYWICAAEFADSAGVDVINTSLGYSLFDDESMNYSYSKLDGKTVRISKAADIAVSTGMIVVVSAGNEGSSTWHYITSPADAISVVTVGAMTKDSIKATFSSFGPTYDGRIKPDVMAMGVNDAIQYTDGTIGTGNGTSFSAPVITGMMACLWQSLGTMTSSEVINILKSSCNNYDDPDNSTGYGVPDYKTAYNTMVLSRKSETNSWLAYPNPFRDQIVLTNKDDLRSEYIEISLYDISGRSRFRQQLNAVPKIYVEIPSSLSNGLYILQIKENDTVSQFKLYKTN